MDKAKKAKIQMMIGLLGAVCLCIGNLVSVSRRPSGLPEILRSLPGLAILIIYIFGMIRKKLKMTRTAFFFWLIAGVAILTILFGNMISWGRRTEIEGETAIAFLIWLFGAISFALATIVLWIGLRGLRLFVESEGELKVENTSQPERQMTNENISSDIQR